MTKKRHKNRGSPSVAIENQSEEPLDPCALRDLGVWCLVKSIPDGVSLGRKIFTVENAQRIEHWLFVYAPALSNADLENLEAATQQFGKPLPVFCKRNRFTLESPLTELGRCRMSKSGRKMYFKDHEELKLPDLVHDEHLLSVVGYPKTGTRLDAKPGSGKAFSIDCEMSLAGTKRVLTRIAVVDFESEKVLLDTLVKPVEPITDYVTQFSGIKPEMMEGVTTDLVEVQSWLREHVGSSDILVGHSLESDLSVLEIVHNRCVDTALVFPHHRGLPMRSSLKYLTKKFLDLNIQGPTTPEKPGHDPIEDSLACVKLIKLKLESGPGFGDTSNSVPLTKVLSEHNIKSTIVDPGVPFWDADGTGNVISVASDTENVAKTLKSLETSGFVFTTLTDTDLKKVGTSMSTLVTDAPPSTLLMIWNGMGDLSEVRELLAKRKRTKEEYRTKKWDEIEDPWTDADDQRLADAEKAARNGTAFLLLTAEGEASFDNNEEGVYKTQHEKNS